MEYNVHERAIDEWNSAAQVYSSPSIEKRTIRLPAMLSEAKDVAGKSVLDFGCGDGFYARRLANMGAQVHGIDFSENMIAAAKRKEERLRQSIVYEVDDVRNFKTQKKFHTVVSDFVLNTLSGEANLEKAFGCSFDALLPGGRFIVTVGHPARVYLPAAGDRRALSLPVDFDYFEDFCPLKVRQKSNVHKTVAWTNYHCRYSTFINVAIRVGFALSNVVELGTAIAEAPITGTHPKYVQYTFQRLKL